MRSENFSNRKKAKNSSKTTSTGLVMEESSEYESSFIDDEPLASPETSREEQARLRRQQSRLLVEDAYQRNKRDIANHRRDHSPQHRANYAVHRRPETSHSKKLKAALSGVLDRSTCTLWEKRGALFDAINNHPATAKPSKPRKRARE